jgi:AcrR family transcriptional regulator
MPTIASREEYFESALVLLAEVGFSGLNIGLLCRTVGVTSGSFYHYFGSWQGFVDALLRYWSLRQEKLLEEFAFGQGGPEQDVEALRKLLLRLPHRAEAAIRAWAMNDESVRIVQQKVDQGRRKTASKVFERIIGDRATAKVVASGGLAMIVGYQQLAAGGEPLKLAEMLDEALTHLVLKRRR